MGGCVEFACGDRRADVYVEHDYGEPPLVIELQHSSTTAKEVESRNRDWSPAQVLWVWDARSWRVEPCRHHSWWVPTACDPSEVFEVVEQPELEGEQ
jgi:hypothetical protein